MDEPHRDDWPDGKLSDRNVVVVKCICFVLSTGLTLCAVGRFAHIRNHFYFGALFCCALLFADDLIYFISFLRGWDRRAVEYTRTFIPMVVGSCISLLTLTRFQVFSCMKRAKWYTAKVQYSIMSLIIIVTIISLTAVSIECLFVDISRFSPVRKYLNILCGLVYGLTDIAFTFLVLDLVYKLLVMRKDTTISETESCRNRDYFQVPDRNIKIIIVTLISLIFCLISAYVFYVFYDAFIYHMICQLFIRLYVVCAVIEWFLIVGVVKASRHYISKNSDQNSEDSSLA